MSRTYRYPRESLGETVTRKESVADLRIQKKLKKQKHVGNKKIKPCRLKKLVAFSNKQNSRV